MGFHAGCLSADGGGMDLASIGAMVERWLVLEHVPKGIDTARNEWSSVSAADLWETIGSDNNENCKSYGFCEIG